MPVIILSYHIHVTCPIIFAYPTFHAQARYSAPLDPQKDHIIWRNSLAARTPYLLRVELAELRAIRQAPTDNPTLDGCNLQMKAQDSTKCTSWIQSPA